MRQLAAQHFWRVHFHKNARPPVVHAILIKEPVRPPSVAKNARMTATSIWVDRPLKGHSLHAIQNRLHLDFDPLDLRQNACSRRFEETRLQRGGNKIGVECRVECRKEFQLEGHTLDDKYEHTFVSMPNAGIYHKGVGNVRCATLCGNEGNTT